MGAAGHLASPAAPAQLDDIFIHLPQPRCADRLSARKASAIGVDRQLARNVRAAFGEPRLLIAIGAKAVLAHMHDFGAAFSILQLRDIDVLGADPGLLERGF